MQKLTKLLFGVADVALAFMLLGGVVTLIRIFFAFLDLTFPGGADEGKQVLDGLLSIMGLPPLTVLSALLLVVAAFIALAYMLSYLLLLMKQVFGLFIMLGLDLLGLLLWEVDPVVTYFVVARGLLVGLPWLLVWVDLRRRGKMYPH